MNNICIGCGRSQRLTGYLHIDNNPLVNPDVCCDALEYIKSLQTNSVDNVVAWHVLEHFKWEDLEVLIDELWRVSKPNAIWNIRVPHVSSIHAANPQHRITFSISFFDFYTLNNHITGEKYGNKSTKLSYVSKRLHILAKNTGLVPRWIANIMPNWMFNNFGMVWQLIAERFWPFRFDEIEWILKVEK